MQSAGSSRQDEVHEDDLTIGDVVYAEPDGFIVLDDGIQTFNLVRAAAWLTNREKQDER